MCLTGANKNIKLTNKRIQRDKAEGQGTCPTKVDIFKWLLRNGVNIAKIDSHETKKEKKKKGRVKGLMPIGWKSLDKFDE